MPTEAPTLFLHIGRNKAGSTTLQTFFAAHAQWLAARGVRYSLFGHESESRADLPGYPSHLHLLEALRDSRDSSILVSNEWISALPADFVAPMVRDLAGARVQVLVYIRPYRDWIVSCYGNDVRRGFNGRDFDSYAARFADRISVWPTLRLWGEGLGWHRVRVRSLDYFDLQGGHLINDCLAAMGLPHPTGKIASRSNENPPWTAIELLRLAADRPDGDGWDDTQLATAAVLTDLMRRARQSCGVAIPHAVYLPHEQAKWLAALYNHDLEQIAAHTGARLRPDEVYHPSRSFLPTAAHIPVELLRDIARRAALPAYAEASGLAAFINTAAFQELVRPGRTG